MAAALQPEHQRFASLPDSLRDEVIPGLFVRAWQIPGAGGYTSLLLKGAAELSRVSPNGRLDPSVLATGDRGLDLLAVKYLIAGDNQARVMLDPERWRSVGGSAPGAAAQGTAGDALKGAPGYRIFENQQALPRAWIASQILPGTDGAMTDAVRSSRLPSGQTFEPRSVALVFEGDLPARQYEAGGSARVRSIEDSRIVVDVDSPGGGFLVLSEMFYPGWRARVDNEPAQPVYRTDLALQGTTVPGGRHAVTFEFASSARRRGLAVSGAGLLCMMAVVGAGLYQAGRVG
jgi:hypothetical protein